MANDAYPLKILAVSTWCVPHFYVVYPIGSVGCVISTKVCAPCFCVVYQIAVPNGALGWWVRVSCFCAVYPKLAASVA